MTSSFWDDLNKMAGVPSAFDDLLKATESLPPTVVAAELGQYYKVRKSIENIPHIVGMIVKVNEVDTNGRARFGAHHAYPTDLEPVPKPTDNIPRIGMNVRILKWMNGKCDPEWLETMDSSGIEMTVGTVDTINEHRTARIGRWWHSLPWLVPTEDDVAPIRRVSQGVLERLSGTSRSGAVIDLLPGQTVREMDEVSQIKDSIWVCGNGRKVKVAEMDDMHLLNTIKFIDRKCKEANRWPYPPIYFVMTAEAKRRGIPVSGVAVI